MEFPWCDDVTEFLYAIGMTLIPIYAKFTSSNTVTMLQLHACDYDMMLMITMSKIIMFFPFYLNILFLILMLETCEHVKVLSILILKTSESNVPYL